MADFATLVLGAETSGLKQAAPAIDKITAAAKSAQSASLKLKAEIAAANAEMMRLKAAGDGASAGAQKLAAELNELKAKLAATKADAAAAAAALDGIDRSGNVAAGSVGNLTAQVFDIGMMMQAGQNPFQLMLQQGSQVAQVLGPMGATGALQAFKGVFAQLLSPVNLLTFGVIGLTAAIVPMVAGMFSGAEASDAQKAAFERQQEIIKNLAAATEDLRIKREMLLSGADSTEEQAALEELKRLTAERADIQDRLNQLMVVGSRAAGYTEQAQAARDILQAELQRVDAEIAAHEQQKQMLATTEQTKDMVEAFKAVMEQAAGINLSGPWQSVLGSIQTAINKAREYAAAMVNAKAMGPNGVGGGRGLGPGGPLVGSADLAALNAGGGVWRNIPEETKGGRGGGGGGGGGGGRSAAAAEAEKEAEAIQKVVDKLKSEIEQVGMNDEARRLHQELQRAGVDIYSQEGQQIAALVEQLTELEAKQKLVAETMRGIENAAQGFFVGVLSGAKDLKSAIGDLLKQLGNLFLNQAFKMLWNGKPGGSGGLGGLIAGLFDAGGAIPAGQVGLVAEKRPELVDGRLVTRPTLVAGPAKVTGGADTARMMGVPRPQMADRPRSAAMAAPAPRVTVTPPPVVVLDDPRKIDAWQRSPEGERAAAWQRKRMGRNG